MASNNYGYQPLPGAVSYAPTVVTASPIVLQHQFQPWSTGLCDVCEPDCPTSCDILCCGYCQLGYQYHRLRYPSVAVDAAVCLGTMCLDTFLCLGFARVAATWSTRQTIAARYNIRQDCCSDFFASWCCNPCVLCQQHREMQRRGEYPGAVCASPGAATATNSVGGASYPPPVNPTASLMAPSATAAPVYGQSAYGTAQGGKV